MRRRGETAPRRRSTVSSCRSGRGKHFAAVGRPRASSPRRPSRTASRPSAAPARLQKDVDATSWRDRPAPEVDRFVVSKWVRETFCGGRPAPRTKTGHREPTERGAWAAAPRVTRVLDTSVPPTAVPAPPRPGPHWWGRLSSGPFAGPLMWHPVRDTAASRSWRVLTGRGPRSRSAT